MKKGSTITAVAVLALAALVVLGKGWLTGTEKSVASSAISGVLPAQQLEESLDERRPTLVLFHSTTCIPCMQMEDIVNEVRPDFEDYVAFIDVNVYDPANRDLVRAARVRTIPTTVLIDARGEARVYFGVIEAEPLREALRQLLART